MDQMSKQSGSYTLMWFMCVLNNNSMIFWVNKLIILYNLTTYIMYLNIIIDGYK